MKIAGSNIQLASSFGRNQGVALPSVQSKGTRHVVYQGAIPKRSRGGTNPLASMPKALVDALQSLKAPQVVFNVTGTDIEAKPYYTPDPTMALSSRIQDGELTFWTKNENGEWERAGDDDVLFKTEEGEEYTGGGVTMGWQVDRLAEPVSGSPEELNKLYNAIGKFNKATGKQVRMILDHNVLSDDGITIVKQVKNIERLA